MTVSTDVKSVRYEGNGVTDTFAFNGRIFTTSDLAVDILTRATDAVVETLAASDYTVSIISDESAQIVVSAGKKPSALQDILIYRAIDREQNLRLPTGTVFPSKDVEDALDKVTILVQDVASDVDRVLKFPLNVSGITAAELPAPVDGMLLTWDGTTGRIGNTDIADISSELDAVFTSLTAGDFIVFDGTNWVNVGKSVVPIDGIKATGSGGVALKNSGGTSVLTIGAGAGTGATFAGGLNISGALNVTGISTLSAALNTAKGADIASATTTNIGAATGNFVHITGTTTITGLGTATAGITRVVRFAGALTLTHNVTSLILPSGANITTAANDTAIFVSEGSGNWRCVSYERASGLPLVPSATINTWYSPSTNPTITNAGTIVTQAYKLKRIGDTLYMRGGFVIASAPASELRIGMPDGLTIDHTKIPIVNSNRGVAGAILWSGNNTGNLIATTDGTNNYMCVSLQNTANGFTATTNTSSFAVGTTIYLDVAIPISGW